MEEIVTVAGIDFKIKYEGLKATFSGGDFFNRCEFEIVGEGGSYTIGFSLPTSSNHNEMVVPELIKIMSNRILGK